MPKPSMPEADRQAELALLNVLERFTEFAAAEAPFAEENLRNTLADLRRLVEENGEPEARDGLVRALLGMYGGMGSVNDWPWSKGAEDAKEELYNCLVAALGVYWGLKGGERHDPASFPVLEVGTRVRLVRDGVYAVDTAGTHHAVDRETFPTDDVWEVRMAYGPDITGTPTYGISAGDRYVSARVSALEVIAPG